MVEKALFIIIILRIFSGSVDITAAMLMYKFNLSRHSSPSSTQSKA
ncbi:DUF2619 domain-containing protein [Sporosarcina sp. FSL K6-3457]